MSRRKLLVLDLPYHARTRSSTFFTELLETEFDVTVDYLSSSSTDIHACVELVKSHDPDCLVLWQVALRARALVELGIPVTWVPMYDQSRRLWHQNFLEAAQVGVTVLAFCKTVGRFARYWNLPCHEVTYYPPPSPNPELLANASRVLLWYRGFIQPSELWPVLKDIPDLRVIVKNDADPHAIRDARQDGELAPFIERVIEGFLPAAEYAELVQSCGLFVAPRRKEGIGLSFLEAMARGSLVIAYDAPTMNEYLNHGRTGWLFSERSPRVLPPAAIPSVRKAAFEQLVEGRAAWESSRAEILKFVSDAGVPSRRSSIKSAVAAPIAALIGSATPLKHRIMGS